MARLKQDDYIRKLDSDFKLAKDAEDEIQSVLAKFICIRLSGFVEVCLKEKIQRFVDKRKTHAAVCSYIENSMRGMTNLTFDKLRNILNSFSGDWACYFEMKVTEEMKSSLGTIYTNRNTIAHGGNANITIRQLEKHYNNLKAVADVLEQSMNR
jgi:hypothetical protein